MNTTDKRIIDIENTEWRQRIKQYLLNMKRDTIKEILKNQWSDFDEKFNRNDVLKQQIKIINDIVDLPQVVKWIQESERARDYLEAGIEDVKDIDYSLLI